MYVFVSVVDFHIIHQHSNGGMLNINFIILYSEYWSKQSILV